jgi:hypothetical protein
MVIGMTVTLTTLGVSTTVGATEVQPTDTTSGAVLSAAGAIADVSYDRWDNRWGQSIGDVRTGDLPDSTSSLTGGLSAPANSGDQYAMRMRTLLTPSVTGQYRFFLSGDDDARLFVNPKGTDPIGARLSAFVAGWTSRGQWDRFSSQRTGWMTLTAGTSYYLEVIGKDGSGDDHFDVGWQRRGETSIAIVPPEVLQATDLGSGGWRPATPAGLPSTPGPFDPQWQVTAGVETLTVSWTAPTRAKWFDVVLEGAGERRRVKVTSPTVSFERLVPETRYLLQVTPANAGGTRARAVGVFMTLAGQYETPVTPARGTSPTVSYDRWNTGWWTLSSIPDGLAPVSTSTLDWGLETPPMQGENHAARIRALVTPTVTGAYRFVVSGDDDARLLFNPSGAQAAKARPIASVSGWTAQYQWDRYASQTSRTFKLVAGRSYYIEAIGVHGYGLDHLEVGWSLNGGPVQVVPASVLRPTRQGEGGWRQTSTSLPRVPDRPTAVQLTATHDTITATWTPATPTPTRGAAEYFEVTLTDRASGRSTTQTVDTPSASFGGLIERTRYDVKVRSANPAGVSGARSASVRTGAAPAPPPPPPAAPTPEPPTETTPPATEVPTEVPTPPATEMPTPPAAPTVELYRARQGDPTRGELASRVYIERNVAVALTQLGIRDVDPDGDGWSLVGRSNGAGEGGMLAAFRLADGVPVASLRHSQKGCIEITPPTLGAVTTGQTRIVRVVAEDTASCRTQPPSADTDADGVADDVQTLYRVRLNDAARGETVPRWYLERSVVAAEAQLGRSDHDPDGDGWALVARSNGEGEYGAIRSLHVVGDMPRIVIDHRRTGCLVFEPPTLQTVASGQTRIAVRSADQSLCLPSPSAHPVP